MGGDGVMPVWLQVVLAGVAVALLLWLAWSQLSDRDR
jgi:hypothetical protein